MRVLVIIPLVVAATAGAGVALLAALSMQFHALEMILAASACIFAGLLSQVSLMTSRGADQIGMSQAGLVATVVHLFVAIAFAAVVILAHAADGIPFIAWLMAFYLVTLIVVAASVISAVRKAPIANKSAA